MIVNKRRGFIISLRERGICLSAILLMGLLFGGCAENLKEDADIENVESASKQETIHTEDVLEDLLSILPENCVIEDEEQEFYRALYKKEYGRLEQSEAAEEELKEFISDYYAQFYLAEYYGVSQAFSFETLKAAWEEENASRQEMKQNGEVFYGPVEYELTDYFGYLYSNLKLKNVEAIVRCADESLIEKGRAYYEAHSEVYDDLIGATCLLSDGERQEERVFSYDDIQSLYKTNEAVLNFIMDSEPGDTMQYQNKDKMVTVELLSKEIDHRDFEEMQGVIMQDYVQREFYDDFIADIAEHIVVTY